MFLKAVTSPYVDFDYYSSADGYMGDEIQDEQTFKRMVKRVTPILDEITFNRVKKLEVIPDCVKDAICAAAEKLYQFEQSPAKEIKSENNDGYSVTYADTNEEKARDDAKAEIRVYLSTSGLLFRGCRKR